MAADDVYQGRTMCMNYGKLAQKGQGLHRLGPIREEFREEKVLESLYCVGNEFPR